MRLKHQLIYVNHFDQVYFNTRVPTQVNTNQHESHMKQHYSTQVQHESTRINTSTAQVNTNQHESDTNQHESDTSPTSRNYHRLS